MYIALVDEQLEAELSSRQKKYTPNKYSRDSDGNQQHNNNQNKSINAK